MKRSSLLLLAAATVFFSLGFSTTGETPISKIYVYGDLLIRSNTAAGRIDFFDLRQSSVLPKVASITLQMNNDVAVVDDIMYADAGRDLVLYDISDIANVHAIDTVRNIFNQLFRPSSVDDMPLMEDDVHGGFSGCSGCGNDAPATSPEMAGGDRSGGTAGSLARFAVAGDYLYCIDYSDVIVFDIQMPRRPQLRNRANVSWDIETLFPYRNTLFVGGQRGVYLVDITDGDAPRPISQFEHGRGCDPVVVENDRAYVTLRSGTRCGDVTDQLHILDVTNLQSPRLLKSVDVTNPYGLAVRDGIVYLCDGTAGVRIIDARDATNPKQVGEIPDIVAHDAILLEQKLIVTTTDRAIVYDLSTPTPLAMGSVSLTE